MSVVKRARAHVEEWHAGTPYLRKFPLNAIWIITLLIVVNCIVWIGVGITLHFEPSLTGTAILSYTLGLRHALDADHICIGTFFSLGHSTIVIVTSIAVAATATAISGDFDRYSRVGGIIGSSVSTAFLVILAAMNVYILVTLILQLRRIQRAGPGTNAEDEVFRIQGGGVLFPLFKKMFRLIDRPWKMYPLGVLFGLGFDTSSEIALLGIASIQAVKGTPIWIILIFPALFTAGMCLIDTLDGALMLAAYTSTSLAHDNIAVLYYSIVLSVVTCVVAVVIGTLQLLTLILNAAEPTGRFWDGVDAAGERYDVIGGAIVATFAVVGVASLLLYRPWRRAFERKRATFIAARDVDADERGSVKSVHEDGEVTANTAATAVDSKSGGQVVEREAAAYKDDDIDEVAPIVATSSRV
ncbi:hypothetical protein ABW21_db0206129 [Orbilia brochopaga]|nr:hypothetical protein ABW21_db0206129 [Drechslerella brochopaga]